jgi:Beta-ketoacyl synthase, N-terminal domain
VIEVCVLGVGALGPGLADWAGGQALLRDPAAWQRQPTVVPPPGRLPPTERRRAGTVVKASIVVADEAVAAAGLDAAQLATVFTSSTGDPVNCHILCEALAAPERLVSPTRFTNSVHNAAAGTWHIATRSRQPSTSLAAFDASFGAGLLEAAVQCVAAHAPVLLVACDMPYPEPLHALRPVADVFALALVLAPPAAAARRLTLEVSGTAETTGCSDGRLEALRRTIPAARALPLLQALAGAAAGRVVLEGLPGLSLRLQVGASA